MQLIPCFAGGIGFSVGQIMWALQATDMSVQVHGFRESSVAGMQGSSRELPREVKPWREQL